MIRPLAKAEEVIGALVDYHEGDLCPVCDGAMLPFPSSFIYPPTHDICEACGWTAIRPMNTGTFVLTGSTMTSTGTGIVAIVSGETFTFSGVTVDGV